MTGIAKVRNSFRKLQDTIILNSEANVLIAAIKLKIFNELSDWKLPEEVAENLALHPESTAALLNSLTAIDFIEKKDDRFRNSSLAEEFLTEGSNVFLGDYLLACHEWYSIMPDDICNLVRNGPDNTNIQDIRSEDTWDDLSRSTVNYQRAGMAQLATGIISALPEYPSFKKMLDLGSGPGLYGISMVLDHMSMQGVLFDRPAVAQFAGSCVKEYGMEDRIEIFSGDYMTDPIGEDYDLVWASMTLNFAGDGLAHIMKKVYDSMRSGGVFVSLSDGLTNEGTKPKEMVLPMFIPALQGNKFGFLEGEISDSMIRAGFESVQSRRVMTPVGELLIDIGRKRKG